jgi:hypothetical protein
MTPPPLPVTLTLSKLDELATFTTYLRVEPADPAADGFEIEGAVMISKTISRDSWEGLGSPVVLTVTLHSLTQLGAVQAQ